MEISTLEELNANHVFLNYDDLEITEYSDDIQELLESYTEYHSDNLLSFYDLTKAKQFIDNDSSKRIWLEYEVDIFEINRIVRVPLCSTWENFIGAGEALLVTEKTEGNIDEIIGVDDNTGLGNSKKLTAALIDALQMKKDKNIELNRKHKNWLVLEDKLRKKYRTTYDEIFAAAKKESKSRGDSDESLIQESKEIVDQMLLSYTEKDWEFGITEWYHQVSNGDRYHKGIMEDKLVLSQSGPDIDGVLRYLERSWMKTAFLDWFCLNVLIYNHYFLNAKKWYIGRYGFSAESLIKSKKKGIERIFNYAQVYSLRFAWFFVKWGLFLALLLFSIYEWSDVATVSIGAIPVMWIGYKTRRQFKIKRKLDMLLDVYELVRNEDIVWKLVVREMEDLRKIDMKISKEVWRILERNGGL